MVEAELEAGLITATVRAEADRSENTSVTILLAVSSNLLTLILIVELSLDLIYHHKDVKATDWCIFFLKRKTLIASRGQPRGSDGGKPQSVSSSPQYLCITQWLAAPAGERRLGVGGHWTPPDVQTGGTGGWCHWRLRFCGQFELVFKHRGRCSHLHWCPAVSWGFGRAQEVIHAVPPGRSFSKESNHSVDPQRNKQLVLDLVDRVLLEVLPTLLVMGGEHRPKGPRRQRETSPAFREQRNEFSTDDRRCFKTLLLKSDFSASAWNVGRVKTFNTRWLLPFLFEKKRNFGMNFFPLGGSRSHPRLLSVRPYSQPLQGSGTRTVTVSPGLKGSSFGLDEEGWWTRAFMALPPLRPSDSPTELERERLGSGDGAAPTIRRFQRQITEKLFDPDDINSAVIKKSTQQPPSDRSEMQTRPKTSLIGPQPCKRSHTWKYWSSNHVSPLEGIRPRACCSLVAHDMSSSLTPVCRAEPTAPLSGSHRLCTSTVKDAHQ